VCHVRSQTTHNNLCLAWCAGYVGTIAGACRSSDLAGDENTSLLCEGYPLGDFVFENGVSDLDVSTLVQQANTVLFESGFSTLIACASKRRAGQTMTVFSYTNTHNCPQIGLVLTDFSSSRPLDGSTEGAGFGYFHYVSRCNTSASSVETTRVTDVTERSITTNAVVPPTLDDGTVQKALNTDSTSSMTGRVVFIILAVAILGLAMCLIYVERNRKRLETVLSDQKPTVIATKSGFARPSVHQQQQVRSAAMLQHYDEDDGWLGSRRSSNHSESLNVLARALENRRQAWAPAVPRDDRNAWNTPSKFSHGGESHTESRSPSPAKAVTLRPGRAARLTGKYGDDSIYQHLGLLRAELTDAASSETDQDYTYAAT